MGSAVIFSGTKVKTLKSTIDLNGGNDIISSTVDPTTSPTSANPGSLLLNSSTGKLYRKNDSGSSTNWTEVGASGQAGINYILNPDAANGTTGWSTYKETDSVTFQDAGDTVTLNNHGIASGTAISFTSITSTTGISTNTLYYVVNPTTNTFQVATSVGGSALALTTNGSGTMVRSIPKTGSGGSPNISWTRNTSSPLRGAADFSFQKGAANYMGEGVAYSFTIDNADIAKTLTVTFDYQLIAGTYSTGDLTVYLIADPTGTPVIIQPAGYQIQSATASTKMRHIATFQTQASGTSYRLVIQIASVNASSYTLDFDTIAVGPQYANYGCPVTDWQSYTPTIVSGAGTIVAGSLTGRWRRVGDTAEVQTRYEYSSGTGAAAEFALSLPSGIVIDSTTIDEYGTGFYYTGVGGFTNTNVRYYSTTAVKFTKNAGTFLQGTDASAAGTVIYTIFQFKVVGWSSNVVMSSDAATNVVASSYFGSNTASVAASTTSTIAYKSKSLDLTGSYNTSTGEYTVPVPGNYYIFAQVGESDGGGSVGRSVNIQTDSSGSFTTVISGSKDFGSAGVTNTIQASGCISVNAGNKIRVVYTNGYAGGAATILDSTLTNLSIQRLSGPAQIAATDTVAASYNNNGGKSIPHNTLTIVNTGWNKTTDSHNAFLNGVYTIPVSGRYLATVSLTYAQAAVVATQYGCSLAQAGSTSFTAGGDIFPIVTGTSNNFVQMWATYIFYCVAGDTITVQAFQQSGSSLALHNNGTFNIFSIIRVGN